MESPLKFEVSTIVQYWSLQHLSNAILAVKEVFLGGGLFTNLCSAKFALVTMKASPKIASHKIQWLQSANWNIARLQSWHSIKHFQIQITPAISTLQLCLGIDCNYGLASTTICEHGFSKQNWVKSDRKSRWKVETLDALMRVPLCDLPMDNMDWTKNFNTWKSTKNRRALPLELNDDQVHYAGNLNNLSASFYCMYFFNTVRHHIIFIFNTKWPISSFLWWSIAKKVWEFEQSVIILKPFTLKCTCALQTWTQASTIYLRAPWRQHIFAWYLQIMFGQFFNCDSSNECLGGCARSSNIVLMTQIMQPAPLRPVHNSLGTNTRWVSRSRRLFLHGVS